MKNHKIEDIEVELFIHALKQRYDYDFSKYAHSSLKRRLKALKSQYQATYLTELIPQILYDDNAAQALVNCITVPMSSFFRDPSVWIYIREKVLPVLSSYPQITIWQTGCSRGQETYSLLILLKECGLLPKCRVIATDINNESIAHAREGIWEKKYMAQWIKDYQRSGGRGDFLHDYFTEQDESVRIKEEFRGIAEFCHHNLVVDEVFVEAHLVLCRNVLIYFDRELQDRVTDMFNRCLRRGGYLVVGQSESITSAAEQECPFIEESRDHRIYRKPIRGGNHV